MSLDRAALLLSAPPSSLLSSPLTASPSLSLSLDQLPYPHPLFFFTTEELFPLLPSLPSLVTPATAAALAAAVSPSDSPSRNKLGRSYNPGRPLAMAERERILALYERGHKVSHIARIIGVTHSCVSKIMTRYRRTGSMFPRSFTSRRKSIDSRESVSSSSESERSAAEEDDLVKELALPPPLPPTEVSHSIERSEWMSSSQSLALKPLMGDGAATTVAEDGELRMEARKAAHGLSTLVAAVFIVADLVGGGVVAMPVAFQKAGLLSGVAFMVVTAAVFEYTAWILASTWVTMERRWPEYKEHCRKPFPEIALRCMGQPMRVFTSLTINLTLFGISVVYLLLSSRIAAFVAREQFGLDVGHCALIVGVGALLAPLTFLKSPSEFWLVVVFAMATTVLAVASIVIGIAIDFGDCSRVARLPEPSPLESYESLGVFLFAFSGHYVFPTIQHDMRRPKDFRKSIFIGFLGESPILLKDSSAVFLLYMPMSLFAFITYGDAMSESVVFSVQTRSLQVSFLSLLILLQVIANVFIALHCLSTLVMVLNPINQELEEVFKIQHHLGVGRILVRSLLLGIVVFTALSVPQFSPVMNFVGAATIPLGCVILPCLFHLWMNAAEEDEWSRGILPSLKQVLTRTRLLALFLNFSLIVLAIAGSALGTTQSLHGLLNANFTAPCYYQAWRGVNNERDPSPVRTICCGPARNVSVYPEYSCNGDFSLLTTVTVGL